MLFLQISSDSLMISVLIGSFNNFSEYIQGSGGIAALIYVGFLISMYSQ